MNELCIIMWLITKLRRSTKKNEIKKKKLLRIADKKKFNWMTHTKKNNCVIFAMWWRSSIPLFQPFTCDVDFPLHNPTPSRTRRRSQKNFVSTFPSNVLVLVSRLMPTHCENRKISLRLAEIDFSCKIFADALSFFLRDWRLCLVLQGVLGTGVGAPKPTFKLACVGFSREIVRNSGIARHPKCASSVECSMSGAFYREEMEESERRQCRRILALMLSTCKATTLISAKKAPQVDWWL